jgi:hypothetical protein
MVSILSSILGMLFGLIRNDVPDVPDRVPKRVPDASDSEYEYQPGDKEMTQVGCFICLFSAVLVILMAWYFLWRD